MPGIREHRGELEGHPVFWRDGTPPDANSAPPLYLHGVPTSSTVWLGFLAVTGGLAPDAGHWPWVDRPEVVDAVAAFFAGAPLPAAYA